jgi:predicted membrane protein
MSIGDEMIALIVVGLLLLTGIQLFRGKWLFLIAGYNTLKQADKEKLNGRFIGKVVGALLLFSSAVIGATLLYPKGKVIWFVCQILLALAAIIYVNTSKKRRC